ncbi:MAG: TrkA family potassium uptake protein, partial [Candidatus Omnitrophota bacterium]
VFAVFGLGMFGLEICKVLAEKGNKVIAVDKDQGVIERVKDLVMQAVLMDSTDEDALRNAGIQDVDVAIVAMGTHVDSSILTTVLLKNIGVPYIVARSASGIHAQVLRKVGATEVMNLEIEEGKRLADRLTSPGLKDVIPLSADQVLAELRVAGSFAGKSLRDLEMRKRFNVNIISIRRTKIDIDMMGNPKREELIFSPKPMDILEVNDIMVLLGSKKDIDALKEAIS